MITCFTGTPGSGKSLHVAKELRDHLRRRNTLTITNYPINPPSGTRSELVCLDSVDFGLLDVLDAYQEWRDRTGLPVKEGQVLLVIDECQLVFSNRDWQKPDRKAWISFFTQHRKLGFNVYLVVQDLGMVDKQIRSIIEYECNHFKAGLFGWFGFLIWLVCLGHPLIVARTRIPRYGASNAGVISRSFFIGRRSLYKMYDTTAMFGADLESLARLARAAAEREARRAASQAERA